MMFIVENVQEAQRMWDQKFQNADRRRYALRSRNLGGLSALTSMLGRLVQVQNAGAKPATRESGSRASVQKHGATT